MNNKHIRYGVIGTGMMGVEHIQNILALENTSVGAIADTDEHSRAAGVHAAGADCAEYVDYLDLLADDSIDAVVVVTPNYTHIDVMRAVIASGKHVLCEKPLCTTTADCQTLIELAEGYEGIIWVGLEYRYMPAVNALIDEVHNGVAGDVKMVAIREHRHPFLEKIGAWNRFSRNTGGTLIEKTCHYFDLMNLLIGTRPVQVFASGAQDLNHLDEIYDGERSDILDNAFVIIDYECGARAMLDLCMFAEASTDQEELVVTGTKGKVDARMPSSVLHIGVHHMDGQEARANMNNVETRHITNDEIRHVGMHHGSSYLEHVDFGDAVRANASIRSAESPAAADQARLEVQPTLDKIVTLDDGLWSIAIGEAAHRSIAENRPVTLAEILATTNPE
ncbi:MAG: myo-inositol 2-dehydrogenase/D-chiro-inositol 1-dehydrogenase [Verrucomicrobiales bacterium]|jgi:myo-inositol 2-dehydrogenase/D-chiro-inositol 1-dehydrogenase